jgi:hypothetical protein
MQDEIVRATGDRDRIELDRAETAEDLQHGVRPTLERARGSERVVCDEKATRVLCTDPHVETLTGGASQPETSPRRRWTTMRSASTTDSPRELESLAARCDLVSGRA